MIHDFLMESCDYLDNHKMTFQKVRVSCYKLLSSLVGTISKCDRDILDISNIESPLNQIDSLPLRILKEPTQLNTFWDDLTKKSIDDYNYFTMHFMYEYLDDEGNELAHNLFMPPKRSNFLRLS